MGVTFAKMNEIELADIYFNKVLALSDSIKGNVRKADNKNVSGEE